MALSCGDRKARLLWRRLQLLKAYVQEVVHDTSATPDIAVLTATAAALQEFRGERRKSDFVPITPEKSALNTSTVTFSSQASDSGGSKYARRSIEAYPKFKNNVTAFPLT